jgi:Tol biopolymer transport system component
MTIISRGKTRRPIGVFVGGFAAVMSTAGAQSPGPTPRVRYVVEARQLGPVGYRDPIGVMSPDGEWLAFTSGGRLRFVHTAGGLFGTSGSGRRGGQIAWLPDSRHVAALQLDDAGRAAWWLIDVPSGARRPLWNGPFPTVAVKGDSVAIDPNRFREAAWSRDGAHLAGILPQERGPALLWTGRPDGSAGTVTRIERRITSPAWMPDGTLACLIMSAGKQYLSVPCGKVPGPDDGVYALGSIAFSPNGATVYYASPNERGTLDLWSRPTTGGRATRLTNYARDTYGPSVARDGRVLFGTQDYRVFVSVVPFAGGEAKQLTAFQSETPSWSRDDRFIGVTYGSWRRVIDDLRYPDIAQDLGLVSSTAEAPVAKPIKVVRASTSEDQGLDWSPNGRWIVLHSHADGLDDLWIQPADGSAPARPITKGGTETGWPRWSPNGQWIAYGTEVPEGGRLRGVLFLVGVDSATGTVTREARRVQIDGIAGDIDQVEWAPSSDSVVVNAADGPEQRAIYVVPRDGGRARLVHRFASGQSFSGLGVSPDFRWIVFVAPATDGYFQLFRVPTVGGEPTQITFDPTDKTQPSVSRDGTRIAFTVFSYRMQFWLLER